MQIDAAIRTEGKRICTKYINEPVTTPYAIMFLPTESLYSEVLRRDGIVFFLRSRSRGHSDQRGDSDPATPANRSARRGDADALGGALYWASSLEFQTPLPFVPKGPVFRLE